MDVIIAVTKSCGHCPILKRELDQMEIPYRVHYLEEHPELVDRFNLRGSPNIIVDDDLKFRKMPEIPELREFFRHRKKTENAPREKGFGSK
jgi:glutaredoxin